MNAAWKQAIFFFMQMKVIEGGFKIFISLIVMLDMRLVFALLPGLWYRRTLAI